MATPKTAPDTETVARALDADPDNLRRFVEHHPNPSVEVVVAAAVVGRDPDEIDEDTRDTVADWIVREQRNWPGPRDEILRYLADHGPATEYELVRALEPIESRRHIRPTLGRLVRRGTVAYEDREDGPALFSL